MIGYRIIKTLVGHVQRETTVDAEETQRFFSMELDSEVTQPRSGRHHTAGGRVSVTNDAPGLEIGEIQPRGENVVMTKQSFEG